MAMAKAELSLILGGARAGKSIYAENLAAEYGPRVLYIATAGAWDDEMRARVIAHRAQRPATWPTLEAPTGVGAALLAARPAVDAILLDCLTMLVSNVIFSHPALTDAPDAEPAAHEPELTRAVLAEVDALLAARQTLGLPLVVVSNEVGLGLVPPYPLGRLYRDILGRANQRVAAAADYACLLVAGLPLVLKSA
jgi:adenosylcobinamide kinase/adenosylcobinamide-phosphate guanylyltransferase